MPLGKGRSEVAAVTHGGGIERSLSGIPERTALLVTAASTGAVNMSVGRSAPGLDEAVAAMVRALEDG